MKTLRRSQKRNPKRSPKCKPKKTNNSTRRAALLGAVGVPFVVLFLGGTALCEPEVVYKIQKPIKPVAQEQPATTGGKAEVAAAKPGPAPAKEGVRPGPPQAENKDVPVYDPTGKTDPFKSFIAEEEAVEEKQKKEPRTYLETLELSQLDLIAIVETSEGNWAMVRDSKGIGYPIRKGTAIGTREGVVQEIKSNEIIIREQHRDIRGKLEVKYVKKELPTPK